MEQGTLPVIGDRSSHIPPPISSESGPSTAGIPKSSPRDKGQPLLLSTTSPPSNNGSKEDPDEITSFLGDEP